jgi:hypothetical protein
MPYKKYFTAILTGCLTYLVIWSSAFYFQLGAITGSKVSEDIHEGYYERVKQANEITGRKLIISAGSNTLGGIIGQEIEETLNIPTVNIGVYAGLGMHYILEKTKTLAKPNDIILLPLEYEHYLYDGELTRELIDYTIARDEQYFTNLPLIKRARFVFSTPISRLIRGMNARLSPSDIKRQTSTSVLKMVFAENTDQEIPPEILKRLSRLKPRLPAKKLDKNSQSWELLRNLKKWCLQNQITLIATFPNFMYFKEYEAQKERSFFNKIIDFYNKEGIFLMGDPYSFMYPKSYFLDTRYHLNRRGRAVHTAKVITLLKDMINIRGERRLPVRG